MTNVDGNVDIVGKKVFFLHPRELVQNKIIAELVQQEYEVYSVKNNDTMRWALKKYPDSIVFVDISDQMQEKNWETWILGIMNSPDTKDVPIGILTTLANEDLKKKYISDINIRCGYTVLKSDLDKVILQLIEILTEVGAKGQRKYIRATTKSEPHATINLPVNGTFVNGQIWDISVVGISCVFDNDPELTKNALVKDIQIKLLSNLLKVEGIIFDSRIKGSTKIYVILFTQRIDPDVRTRIRRYIHQNLQAKMDSEEEQDILCLNK